MLGMPPDEAAYVEGNDVLIIRHATGPLAGKEQKIEAQSDRITIGRDPDADIPLSSRAASRRHCLVVRAGDQYLVRDLGSHNGTLVNGVPINERVLENGDQITVVDSVFAFVRDGREGAFRPEVTEISDGNAVEFSRVQLAETIYRNPPRLLAEAEAAKLGSQLKALLDINRKAATSRDPEDLQQVLLDAAFQLTPAERAAVLLYEQLDVTASSMMGQHRSARRTAAIPVSQTVVRRVLAEKVTVLARDVVTEEAFKNIHSLAASGSRSILCVPLLSRDRCLGVLYLEIQNPTLEFDDGHLETLTSVAAVVGLSLENALDFQRMRAQAALLRAALEQDRAMVGESPAMKAIYECIAKVAPSDTTVLILGESGTGKDRLARAIHDVSTRSASPFVRVDAANLSDDLFEDVLDRDDADDAAVLIHDHGHGGALALQIGKQIVQRLGLGHDRSLVHDRLDGGLGPLLHETLGERAGVHDAAHPVTVAFLSDHQAGVATGYTELESRLDVL